MRVTHVSLLVRDQREAQQWYSDKLGWVTVTDMEFPGGGGHWVTMAPPEQGGLEVVLDLPTWGGGSADPSREGMVGKAPGFVLYVEDCQAIYEQLSAKGVEFTSPPEAMPWGVSAVFVDLYGTAHNFVQPPTP